MARPLPEMIAVQPATFGDREFGEHAGLELDAIIAGLGVVGRMTLAKDLATLQDRARFELQSAPRWPDEHVKHFDAAGSREIPLAETTTPTISLVEGRAG